MALFGRKKKIEEKEVKAEKAEDLPLPAQTGVGKAEKKVSAKIVAPSLNPEKPEKIEKPTKPTKEAKGTKDIVAVVSEPSKDISAVLRRPRITEKATFQTEDGVYVFEVSPRATKTDIKEAIKHFYKVTPVKVNVTKIPEKQIFSRARRQKGVKGGGKKAYVYLKKGDKIEII